MASPSNRPDPMVRWVHRSLLTGVAISGTILIAGLGWMMASGQPRPAGLPPSIGESFAAAMAGESVAMLQVGLLALMLTPVARVAILGFGWLFTGQRRFAVTSFVVLALLVLSILLGTG